MKEPPYKYMVRLPAPMKDLIAESARHYRRSLNSDIVARLHYTFSGLGNRPPGEGLEVPLHDQFETLFRRELSADEERLLKGFRRLPEPKRQALLELLS